MATDFFGKKRWHYIAFSQILAGFISICMCYAVMLNYASPIWMGKSFYFLVSTNTHIEVGAQTSRLDGGAGYLFNFKGEEYVAWSVYFHEADGMAVQADISNPTKLIKVDVSYLYLKTRIDKKRKKIIQGALNSFYGCIDILSQGIAKLDKGLTQEACKRILTVLRKEYAYMSQAYLKKYPQFAKVCTNMQTVLDTLLKQTVYGKDLRYLLCSACDAFIRLASVFSL